MFQDLFLACLSFILVFKSSTVSCVYCRYYPPGSFFSNQVWCPNICCGGYPTSISDACCSSAYGASYWWISLIVIAIVGIVGGIVGVVLCCLCCRKRRAFGGRVLYKPPDQQPQQTVAPFTITTPAAQPGGTAYHHQSNYPSAVPSYPSSNPTNNIDSDKPPAYDFVVPNSQPATVNVTVQDRTTTTTTRNQTP